MKHIKNIIPETLTRIGIRNDPAKQRKKLGKVKDLWVEHQADKDDRLYQELIDDIAIEKANNKSEKRGNNE